MKKSILLTSTFLLLTCSLFAEDAMLERAKMELLVEQAQELLAESNRKGSETHTAAHQYFFGMIYGSGTNILARKESVRTSQLQRKYMELIEKNYEAYTKVENAFSKAAATGNDRVHVGRHVVVKDGSRHRAKRIANAEKLGDAELAKAIKQWENFVRQLKKEK